jgi:hypothetical protein
MKTAVIIFLIGMGIPAISSAQVKPVLKIKDVRKSVIQAPVNQNQPAFFVKSAEVLRTEVSQFTPVVVATPPESTPAPTNLGSPAYKTNNGVVLDALNPYHPVTRSLVDIRGTDYSREIPEAIKNNTAPVIVQDPTPLDFGGYHIRASFNDISSSTHTYLLTLGTNATPDITTITVNTYGYSHVFEKGDLVHNPATSEIRLLFTFNAATDPLGVATTDFKLYVSINYSPETNYVLFHHIQLVQID